MRCSNLRERASKITLHLLVAQRERDRVSLSEKPQPNKDEG
jgi:hypothetical protein